MLLYEFTNEEKVLTGCVGWLSSFQRTYCPLSLVGHSSLEHVNSGRAGLLFSDKAYYEQDPGFHS